MHASTCVYYAGAYDQDLHERLNMRRRLHASPITTFLDAAEEPEASQPLNPSS